VELGVSADRPESCHQQPSNGRSLHSEQVADRKWEIPREWLIIEQTLGEGEFGKVVRASVTSVTGISGD
jgi:hypothetical protein